MSSRNSIELSKEFSIETQKELKWFPGSEKNLKGYQMSSGNSKDFNIEIKWASETQIIFERTQMSFIFWVPTIDYFSLGYTPEFNVKDCFLLKLAGVFLE